jgi:thiamine biosynthesis lipoprotein
VTVAGPDPAWAEVWSKTLFLGGRVAIAAEARSRGLAAWWVAHDGTLEMTAAARSLTTWVAAEAV